MNKKLCASISPVTYRLRYVFDTYQKDTHIYTSEVGSFFLKSIFGTYSLVHNKYQVRVCTQYMDDMILEVSTCFRDEAYIVCVLKPVCIRANENFYFSKHKNEKKKCVIFPLNRYLKDFN